MPLLGYSSSKTPHNKALRSIIMEAISRGAGFRCVLPKNYKLSKQEIASIKEYFAVEAYKNHRIFLLHSSYIGGKRRTPINYFAKFVLVH